MSKGGGRYCAVFRCHNSQGKLLKWRNSLCEVHDENRRDCPCLEPFRFFRFPKGQELRRDWIKSLNRKDFKPSEDSVVCSIHFVDGEEPKTSIPQLHLGYTKKVIFQRRPLKKNESLKKGQVSSQFHDTADFEIDKPDVFDQTASDENVCMIADSNSQFITQTFVPRSVDIALDTADIETFDSGVLYQVANDGNVCVTAGSHSQLITSTSVATGSVHRTVDQETQTNSLKLSYGDHNYCKLENTLPKETKNAANQTESHIGRTLIFNQRDCTFYTGLSVAVFNSLMLALSPLSKKKFQISVPEQFLLVFMRLRLSLTLGDLSRRFHVSKSTASSIFNSWISVMAENLQKLIIWLPRETIMANLPEAFKESYPKTTCIVDCTEIFTEKPKNLRARATTWSNYKSHNTLKFLICISPHGYIMFVSPLYGGRASDKFICADSGIYHYMLPGDEVMADRGLLISDELAAIRVSLNVPPYLKNRNQMTQEETINTRRCASVRVHVERVIARVKSYRILKGVVPATIRQNLDDVITVCAALCNLKSDIIKTTDV